MIFLKPLEELPWLYSALLMVTLFIGFTISLLLIVRKKVKIHRLKEHHDVAGFVFANLGVLYSVLIGFTVVNVQQRFDSVKQIATREAGYLAELYEDAEVFPEKYRNPIRDSIEKYGRSVMDVEWGLMEKAEESPETIDAFKNIWHAYYMIDPQTDTQKLWFAQSLSTLNHLLDARLARLLGAEESLSPELWFFLLVGGIVLVTFICFFGMESLPTHILMASILAASTGFLLFLIYSLDTAFSGAVSIPPDPFVNILHSFEEASKKMPPL